MDKLANLYIEASTNCNEIKAVELLNDYREIQRSLTALDIIIYRRVDMTLLATCINYIEYNRIRESESFKSLSEVEFKLIKEMI